MWFVALVFLGTGAVSVLAYLDQIGGDTADRALSPFVEASAGGELRPVDDPLSPGLSKHYYNRRASLPDAALGKVVSARTHSLESPEELDAKPVTTRLLANSKDTLVKTPELRKKARPIPVPLATGNKQPPAGTSNAGEKSGASSPSAVRADSIRNDSIRNNENEPAKKLTTPKASDVTIHAALQPSPPREKTGDPLLPMKEARTKAGFPRHKDFDAQNTLPKQEKRPAVSKSSQGRSMRQKQEAKRTHNQRGWLPTGEEVTQHPRHSPLEGLMPKGPGWTEAPSQATKKQTRFADINRPTPPGAGPVFATSRHPGLLGVLDGHDEPIHAVRFAPSGNTLISAAENGHVRHWNTQKGIITKTLNTSAPLLLSADWSKDWQTLALLGCSSKACSLDVRSLNSGRHLQEIAVERAHIGAIALSPDAQLAAIATDGGRVSVAALGTAHELSWQAHEAGIWTVAFDPFGRYLATGGLDHHVKVWEPRTGELVHTLKEPKEAIHTVAFAPNGLYIATAGADSIVRLYRASTGKLIRRFTGHLGTVRSLVFDETGRRLASAGDHSVRIWELKTGQELTSIGWEFAVTSLAFSPDGTKLLAGDVVGLLTLWNAQIGSGSPPERTASR